MFGLEQLERLWSSLLGLGARRLAGLGIVGVTVFAAVGFGSYYLSRPDFETLYIGLNAQDVSRIGAALKEAGVTFDVNSQGNAVSVRRGQTAQARMLLAEKGLPTSSNAGYELFDKMGSMGLTSFMQEITRLRALEGEIARTIQAMKGVKGARVHIVLPDTGSFRRTRQQPSASVIIRTESVDDISSAAGDQASRGCRGAGHDRRSGDGAQHGRRADGRGQRCVQRLAGQDAYAGEDPRQGTAGQRHARRWRPTSGPTICASASRCGSTPTSGRSTRPTSIPRARPSGRCARSRRRAARRTATPKVRPSASSRTSRRTRRRPPVPAATRTRSRTSAAKS